MGKYIEGAGGEQLQGQGNIMGHRLLLHHQVTVQVLQRVRLALEILEVLLIDVSGAAVDDGLFLGSNLTAAHKLLTQGHDELAFQHQRILAVAIFRRQIQGIDVAALIAGGRDSNDFAAQRPNQGAVLSLRVYHDYVVVCAKDQRRQLLLCRHGLAGAGYTEEKAVAVEEISPVTDNQIVGDSIDAVVNTAFVLDLLGLERHENGGALGSQAAHGIHPLEAIGEHGIEAVLLLIFEGRDLTASPLPY